MQFQDPSAGGYGGAGGATGAIDEDDDGKQLLVIFLYTIRFMSYCTLVPAFVLSLHGAAIQSMSVPAICCLCPLRCHNDRLS